ncbi:hypothetical protein [Burkholderia ubonensis]|uniref:hypothetical protein n=1 Tax=Burkholderia ubonensis TaxID=101571 RepID=UPI0011788FAF|nr:hypothetical protein [Burkholderia ubonensis]
MVQLAPLFTGITNFSARACFYWPLDAKRYLLLFSEWLMQPASMPALREAMPDDAKRPCSGVPTPSRWKSIRHNTTPGPKQAGHANFRVERWEGIGQQDIATADS